MSSALYFRKECEKSQNPALWLSSAPQHTCTFSQSLVLMKRLKKFCSEDEWESMSLTRNPPTFFLNTLCRAWGLCMPSLVLFELVSGSESARDLWPSFTLAVTSALMPDNKERLLFLGIPLPHAFFPSPPLVEETGGREGRPVFLTHSFYRKLGPGDVTIWDHQGLENVDDLPKERDFEAHSTRFSFSVLAPVGWVYVFLMCFKLSQQELSCYLFHWLVVWV